MGEAARATGTGGIIGWGTRPDKIAILVLLGSAALYSLSATIVTGAERAPGWLSIYLSLWLGYLLLCTRRELPGAAWLLGAAFGFRLLLCWSEPWLSDDVYRYLLDGRSLAAGINPYRFAPAAEEMSRLAPDLAAAVNHPELPTIYPPLVPLLSALAAQLGLGIAAWRILISLCDLGTMFAVGRLFSSWRAAAVYGLCPLAVVESGANGHLEGLLLFCWVLAVQRLSRGALRSSGLLWTLAILTKYLPIVSLFLWMRRRSFSTLALASVGAAVLVLWAFSWGGVDPFASLRVYVAEWRFNAPLFDLLARTPIPQPLLRALPFVVLGLGTLRAVQTAEDPLRALPRLLFLFLLLSPTVHPWYALWLLPWLGPRPHWGLWAFVGSMGLSYVVWWQVARGEGWGLSALQESLIWGSVALAWAAERWRARRVASRNC